MIGAASSAAAGCAESSAGAGDLDLERDREWERDVRSAMMCVCVCVVALCVSGNVGGLQKMEQCFLLFIFVAMVWPEVKVSIEVAVIAKKNVRL